MIVRDDRRGEVFENFEVVCIFFSERRGGEEERVGRRRLRNTQIAYVLLLRGGVVFCCGLRVVEGLFIYLPSGDGRSVGL